MKKRFHFDALLNSCAVFTWIRDEIPCKVEAKGQKSSDARPRRTTQCCYRQKLFQSNSLLFSRNFFIFYVKYEGTFLILLADVFWYFKTCIFWYFSAQQKRSPKIHVFYFDIFANLQKCTKNIHKRARNDISESPYPYFSHSARNFNQDLSGELLQLFRSCVKSPAQT